MHSFIKIQILMMATALSLVACEKESVSGAQSLEYYGAHLSEADSVISQCNKLEKNELSVMSPTQRLAWMETTEGINCHNASEARSNNDYAAHQKQMREAAAKYR